MKSKDNADPIVAEMLGALKKALPLLQKGWSEEWVKACKDVRAAIAKAEGT